MLALADHDHPPLPWLPAARPTRRPRRPWRLPPPANHTGAATYQPPSGAFRIATPPGIRQRHDFKRTYMSNGAWKAFAGPDSQGQPLLALVLPGSNKITAAELRIGVSDQARQDRPLHRPSGQRRGCQRSSGNPRHHLHHVPRQRRRNESLSGRAGLPHRARRTLLRHRLVDRRDQSRGLRPAGDGAVQPGRSNAATACPAGNVPFQRLNCINANGRGPRHAPGPSALTPADAKRKRLDDGGVLPVLRSCPVRYRSAASDGHAATRFSPTSPRWRDSARRYAPRRGGGSRAPPTARPPSRRAPAACCRQTRRLSIIGGPRVRPAAAHARPAPAGRPAARLQHPPIGMPDACAPPRNAARHSVSPTLSPGARAAMLRCRVPGAGRIRASAIPPPATPKCASPNRCPTRRRHPGRPPAGTGRRRDWPRWSDTGRPPRRCAPVARFRPRSGGWRAPGTSARRPPRDRNSHSTGRASRRARQSCTSPICSAMWIWIGPPCDQSSGAAPRASPARGTARSECSATPMRSHRLLAARAAFPAAAGRRPRHDRNVAGVAPARARRSRRSCTAPAAGSAPMPASRAASISASDIAAGSA